MQFRYTIHPKKRGNWRPLVEVEWAFSDEDVQHRPIMSALYLQSGNFISSNMNVSFSHHSIVVQIMKDNKYDKSSENWALYSTDKRGDPSVHKHCGCNQYSTFCDHGSLIPIIPREQFLEKGCHGSFNFYAPWKQGSKPDYSEIVPALIEIRDYLRMMQTEGIDSGETGAITEQMIAKGNDWVIFKKNNNYNDNGEYRALDLDLD